MLQKLSWAASKMPLLGISKKGHWLWCVFFRETKCTDATMCKGFSCHLKRLVVSRRAIFEDCRPNKGGRSLSRAHGQGCSGKIAKNKSFTCSFVLILHKGLHCKHQMGCANHQFCYSDQSVSSDLCDDWWRVFFQNKKMLLE